MSEPGRGRIERIEAALREALAPLHLEIEDESHRHRGHAGAADGRGHFRVCIVSQRFAGCSRLKLDPRSCRFKRTLKTTSASACYRTTEAIQKFGRHVPTGLAS